jgi:DNA polymerase-1
VNQTVVLNPSEWEIDEDVVCLDLETSGLKPYEDTIKLIIIGTSKHLYLFDVGKYAEAQIRWLFECIKDKKLIAHNAKFDCSFIFGQYRILLENWWCTMIASQVITNGKSNIDGHSLPQVIKRYLGKTLEFAENKKLLQKSFTNDYRLDQFTEKQLKYAADDVRYLMPLYQAQKERIAEDKLETIIRLESALLPVLAKMEVEGCLIDKDSWAKQIKEKWEPALHEIEKKLDVEVESLTATSLKRNKARVISYDLFGLHTEQVICSPGAINYASQGQILQLFRDLNQPVPIVTVKVKQEDGSFVEVSRESVDDGALTAYINENPKTILKKFIEILKEYREISKLISTYGDKFLLQLDKNNHIHTGYTQTTTETSRLSSKSPNLQNIPAYNDPKDDWKDVRRFFIAPPGYKFITCDMNGAEVALAADFSQEPMLIDSILKGTDLHSALASTTFTIIFGEDTPISKSEVPFKRGGHEWIPNSLRTAHKTVLFAKFYKGGARRIYATLAEYINLYHETLEDRMRIARKISKAIDEQLPLLSDYLDKIINKAQTDGYLRMSKLGRIRYFNEDVYGDAANAPLQCSNSEAIKIAMIKIYRHFKEKNWDARLVGSVHDETKAIAKDDIAEEAAAFIKKEMGDALSFFLGTIKGGASVNIAQHWKK